MNQVGGAGGFLSESNQNFFTATTGAKRVQVFREFKPMRDVVEITVIYRIGDEKRRVDFEEKAENFSTLDGSSAEWYFVGRAVEAILRSEP